MKALASHVLAEFYNCDRDILNNTKLLEDVFKEATRLSGATLVGSHFHTFSPYGVSGVIVIAESHLSVHTWPEYGYAAVDIFTCGDTIEPEKAFAYIKENLQASHTATMEMRRGQLHDIEGELKHKPSEEAGPITTPPTSNS